MTEIRQGRTGTGEPMAMPEVLVGDVLGDVVVFMDRPTGRDLARVLTDADARGVNLPPPVRHLLSALARKVPPYRGDQ